jgi:uncharacterized protein YmfQ (DUF2313 family)
MYGNNLYGTTQYAANTLTNADIQSYTPDLMHYLPVFYQNSYMELIQNSNAKELGIINYNLDDLQKQFFVDTATWGLNYWEEFLGIPTDLMQTIEARREVIKAKIRGTGAATKAMIKNMAEAFSGGEVDVIENFADYSFIVQFIGIKGIPQNLNGLKNAIDMVKPAHLSCSFKYSYTVWDFIKNKAWNNFNNATWNSLKIYEG